MNAPGTVPSRRIVVVGEALVDLVAGADRRIHVAHPGGSPLNVAYGLARLGRPTSLLTRIGDDTFGALVRDHLHRAGVDLLAPPEPGLATSLATVTLDAEGAARYDFRIDWDLPAHGPLPRDTAAVHTGSIAAALEPGASEVRALLVTERDRGRATISFDPNCRPALMGDPRTARARTEQLVALSDVVKASDEDLRALYGERPVEDVAAAWLDLGASLVVVTRGAHGSYAAGRAATVTRPAAPADVVDTVGAGDSFMSALLDSLAREQCLGGDRRPALAALSADALTHIVDRAARAAAVTVGRTGAMPPDLAELDATAPAGQGTQPDPLPAR
ncbi:carbohydrate kinase family protein [Streptomyces thermodiastaticus]